MTDTPKRCEAAVYPPNSAFHYQCSRKATVAVQSGQRDRLVCKQHAKYGAVGYPKEYRHDD